MDVGIMDPARFADYSRGLVAGILAAGLIIADAIGDVRHDPGIGEGIGAISFGIGQSLDMGVVVLGGFHDVISISGLGIRTISARPDHS